MKFTRHFAATSILAITLMTASPAFADSDKKGSDHEDRRFGVGINTILKSFNGDHNRKSDDKKSSSTSDNSVSVSAMVTAVNGSTVTLLGSNGAVYTVSVTSATKIQAQDGTVLALSNIRVGDSLKVKGTLSGSIITASSIVDKSTIDSSFSQNGTMSALSGSVITFVGENNVTYSVNTAGATINGSTDVSAQLAKFAVGDKLIVKGTLLSGTVTASKIKNMSLSARESLTRYNGVRGGTVTATGSGTITIDRFGTGSTNVITSGATFYVANGSATTSSAVKLGSNLIVFGTTTTNGTNDTITASVVLVIDHSIKFFKRIFGSN